MANSVTHAALPYPIKNARFTIQVPYLDADGDPTDPTTPDTELSGDGGAFADCAEEVTTITGSNGMGYLTLTGAETNYSMVAVCAKVASGPKATLGELYPRVLASVGTGTLSAGSAGGGTLGTLLAYDVTGCFIQTTGGTGGGGTGGASNQARKIVTYTTSTGAFTVTPNWETTPSTDTTYSVLLPEGVTLGMLKTLNPTTAGRTLDVTATGAAGIDWGNVENETTTVGLSNTSVLADVRAISGSLDGVGALSAFYAETAGAKLSHNILDQGTAQAVDSTTITLRSGGVSVGADVYVGNFIQVVGSSQGYAQTREILSHTSGSSPVVTVAAFTVTPSGGTVSYKIFGRPEITVGALTTVGTVTNLTNAPSDSSGVTTLLGKFTGITLLAQWLGLIAGKQTGNSTARTELRASGAGSGTFDETTDSLEAIKDSGSAGLDAAGVRAAVGLASANLDTQLSTIVADTNELQTDWANGGRLDLILDTAAAGGSGGGGAGGTFAPGTVLNFKFKTADSTGAGSTASSLAVSCYKDDSTTQSTAGITTTYLTGFDSMAGSVNVKVDTSADGTFYSAGSSFNLVVTAGTADGVSLIGEPVGDFHLADALDIPTAAENATELLATTLYSGWSITRALKKILSMLTGKTSGLTSGAGTYVVRDPTDSTNEETFTVDSNGNRTDVTHGA